MRRLPSLESLRVFDACARHGSFAQAAAELAVTPAAVSLRIRQLEGELDTLLFDRKGPRVALTDVGTKLASRMAEIMSRLRRAVEECRSTVETIRVTAVPTIAHFLAPRLSSYEAADESVSIALSASTKLEPNARFDVAVRSGQGGWPGLESVAVFPIDLTPMIARSCARASELAEPADILKFPLIPADGWGQWFEETGVDATEARFRSINYPTQDLAAMAAVAGAGVALVSPVLFRSLTHEGFLIQPFAHICRRPDAYHLLVQSGEMRPSVIRFCDWLRSEWPNNQRELATPCA